MASVLTPAQQSQLSQRLRAIVGPEAVVDKPDELLVYECDAYTLEKSPPNAVVLPHNTEQISTANRRRTPKASPRRSRLK
jgi:hypothetical protein